MESKTIFGKHINEEATFGKCMTCGRLRWVSTEALRRKQGWSCLSCGSRGLRQPQQLSFLERCRLVRWIFWEHVKINPGSLWYLNPLNLRRIVSMGMHPQLHRSAPAAEKGPDGEKDAAGERNGSAVREGEVAVQEPAHSDS